MFRMFRSIVFLFIAQIALSAYPQDNSAPQDNTTEFFKDIIKYQNNASIASGDLRRSITLLKSDASDVTLPMIQAYLQQAPDAIGGQERTSFLELGSLADKGPNRVQSFLIVLANLHGVAGDSDATAENVTRLSSLAQTPGVAAAIVDARRSVIEHRNRIKEFVVRAEKLYGELRKDQQSTARLLEESSLREYLQYVLKLTGTDANERPLSRIDYVREREKGRGLKK